MAAGLVGTKAGENLPPGRRNLARHLAALYEHLGTQTLRHAADHLAARGYKKDPSEISRYLNGERLPPASFVAALYDAAAAMLADSGHESVSMTKEHVHEVHAAAEPRLCRSCAKLRRRIRKLQADVKRLHALRAGLQAGLETAQSTGPGEPAPLPVPPSDGDRQQTAQDVAAARQVASRAGQLQEEGAQGEALSYLQQTSEVLTPVESAAALVLLRRQRQDQLAETLIQMYGRDQADRDVLRVALELHRYGQMDDVGAILRAAARRSGPQAPL
ncbi:hypothetical protein GCM10010275_24770 [Streptomyces litmocidini]|uniref:hypothetical protein n=1 Tax=Streptomyces litmocidini TaxID=67318 RepID=UPI00167D8C1A|nr:hypothetical protein [Streptomyces litmocidini]GGU87755.1 hypothetical protein GCM10010275_24770 [Streptomyces litmocidini]